MSCKNCRYNCSIKICAEGRQNIFDSFRKLGDFFLSLIQPWAVAKTCARDGFGYDKLGSYKFYL